MTSNTRKPASALFGAAIVTVCLLDAAPARGGELEPGVAEPVLILDPGAQQPLGDHPEGITVDRTGTIFVGNRHITESDEEGLVEVTSEILRIDPDGTVSEFVTLGTEVQPQEAGVLGILGLATDAGGNVYAAVTSFFAPDLHGVWWISADGSQMERLPGSQDILFPNALVFYRRDMRFVSDSLGAVWRLGPDDDAFMPFLIDPLLAPPGPPPGLPIPPVGANGIAIYPPNRMYVANTQGGWLVEVPIADDLNPAGPAEIVAQDLTLLTLDGIKVDASGDVHGVIPGFALLDFFLPQAFSPLVRIDPDSGDVAFTVTEPDQAAKFKTPLSLSFGKAVTDVQSVFVTNGNLPEDLPGGPPPSVLQVGTGIAGFRLD